MSAGCSTGEEPYSIAMSFLYSLTPSAGWSIDILATDLLTRALDRAGSGVFTIERASEIPIPYLEAFMLKGTGENESVIKADAQLRSVVRFERLNLSDAMYTVAGQFDLIFCRNVLIYFDATTKNRVIKGLLNHLAQSGLSIYRARGEPPRRTLRPAERHPNGLLRAARGPRAIAREGVRWVVMADKKLISVLVMDDSAVVRGQ